MKNQKVKIETKIENNPEEKPEDIFQVENISLPNKVVSKKRKKNLSKVVKPRKNGKLHYIYQSYRLDILELGSLRIGPLIEPITNYWTHWLIPKSICYQNFFRDKAISDIQPPGPTPRNSHFLSVNNKTLVDAGDLGGESEKLKLADNKYENQLNALRLEEMFKNVFIGATHQDIRNLKAQKYTQD